MPNDISKMWEIFERNITISLDTVCPIKEILVSSTRPEWLNNEIIQLMRGRDRAYVKPSRTKTEIDWKKATFLRNRVELFITNYTKIK